MTADIERRLYGDRTLVRFYDPESGDSQEGWADVAHEAIRAMNHLTSGHPIPAPVAYSALGNLGGLAHMLPQLCDQLARGLERSLTEFNVYDNKQDPAASVAEARIALEVAMEHARALGSAFDAAQVAINSQGYNAPDEENDR